MSYAVFYTLNRAIFGTKNLIGVCLKSRITRRVVLPQAAQGPSHIVLPVTFHLLRCFSTVTFILAFLP